MGRCFIDWATVVVGEGDTCQLSVSFTYHSSGPIYETLAQSTKFNGKCQPNTSKKIFLENREFDFSVRGRKRAGFLNLFFSKIFLAQTHICFHSFIQEPSFTDQITFFICIQVVVIQPVGIIFLYL